MLLDLPSELINVITGYLAPRPLWPRLLGHCPFEICTCVPGENLDRQVLLYHVPESGTPDQIQSYETSTLRLATAHPYIARSIADGGWHGVVEMSRTVDLDVIGCVPDELRGMVRIIDLRRVPMLTILSRRLQESLQQFPAVHRLDIQITEPTPYFTTRLQLQHEIMARNPAGLDRVPGSDNGDPDWNRQITDLVVSWHSDEFVPLKLFAESFPLPSLAQLHITLSATAYAFPTEEEIDRYQARFGDLETVAVVWKSLNSVQAEDEHTQLEIWNVWQVALESLFHAFRSNPSCKIGVCITYMFDTDSVIPLDQTFPRLPGGNRILCNEMAPRNEAAVRTFLNQLTHRPIPPFNLSVKHGEEGSEPIELLKVSYNPLLRDPSSDIIDPPTEGTLTSTYYYERLDRLYKQAREGYF